MLCKYSLADLPARLDKSMISYQSYPYYVREIDGETLYLTEVFDLKKVVKTVKSSDPLVSIESLPLGYFNYTSGTSSYAIYVRRVPRRQYKQGVYHNNVKCDVLRSDGKSSGADQTTIYSQGFRDAVLKEYPSWHEALELLKSRESIALSRDIALVGRDTIRVFLKEEEVGFFKAGSTVVKIPSSDKSWVISKYLSQLSWEID